MDTPHLSHDELLKSLAGVNDQTPETLAHLNTCQACRQALARIERRFSGIGQMARELAPEPGDRPLRLPERRRAALPKRFNPILAAGVGAALILMAATWVSHRAGPTDGSRQPPVRYSLEDDQRLMRDIDALVNNALPEDYQRLAGSSEPVFDEDLINWIVPSIEEADHSLTS